MDLLGWDVVETVTLRKIVPPQNYPRIKYKCKQLFLCCFQLSFTPLFCTLLNTVNLPVAKDYLSSHFIFIVDIHHSKNIKRFLKDLFHNMYTCTSSWTRLTWDLFQADCWLECLDCKGLYLYIISLFYHFVKLNNLFLQITVVFFALTHYE